MAPVTNTSPGSRFDRFSSSACTWAAVAALDSAAVVCPLKVMV